MICDQSEQAALFESLPVFAMLVSSMTTRIDGIYISQYVTQYYDYAMFFHWEPNEFKGSPILHQGPDIVYESRHSQLQGVARDHLGDGGGNRSLGTCADGPSTPLGRHRMFPRPRLRWQRSTQASPTS